MKNTEIRCPSCDVKRSWIYVEDTTIGGLYILRCNYCGHQWKSMYSPKYRSDIKEYHYPLELKEHKQYLKDGIKLTEQDKLDLQIDLWQYGKR